MTLFGNTGLGIIENWPVWFVTITLIVAAFIDGKQLRVPNWLTFPLIISGWIYSFATFGFDGLLWSLGGTAVGLVLLLPAYAIGGMGAGDVKLLAGVGAWMHATHTFWAFAYSAVFGAIIAIGMVVYSKSFRTHLNQFWMILGEIFVIKNPTELAEIAAQRKPTMMLLPYGIPIAIGSIVYFFWSGLMI
jgi:prepilin peptidase CpaA